MADQRISYEKSYQRLQESYLDDGEIPPFPNRMPRFDDSEPLGVSFFRTLIGKGDKFDNLTLPRTFFGRCEINSVSFINTDLSESLICWNDFIDVDFTDADLAGSDMRASNFTNVRFERTNLKNTDMRRSSFNECIFKDAEMTGAILAKNQGTQIRLSPLQISLINWEDENGPEPDGG